MKRYLHVAAVASFMLAQRINSSVRFTVPPLHRASTSIGSGRPDLAKLTVKELRMLATKMKIKGRSKATRKADLVKLIEKAGAL